MNFKTLILFSLILNPLSFQQVDAKKSLPENTYAMFSPYQGDQAFKNIYNIISSAQNYVHLSVYSWSDMNILKSLYDALENGAKVRVLLHPPLARKKSIQAILPELEAAGADVKIASKNMHEKILLVDDLVLVNSSANLSTGARMRYGENFIFHHDKSIIAQFSEEFSILWNSGKDFFSNNEPIAPPLKIVSPEKISKNYRLVSSSFNFSIVENDKSSSRYNRGQYIRLIPLLENNEKTWKVRDEIINAIYAAKKSIYLSINHFNIQAIADALFDVYINKGIDVKLYVDNQEYRSRPNGKEMTPLFYKYFTAVPGNKKKVAPIRVKFYSLAPSPRYWLLNHHKYILIDYELGPGQTILLSGSYNMSKTAEHKQFDNLVIYSGPTFSGIFNSFYSDFKLSWYLNRDESDNPNTFFLDYFLKPTSGGLFKIHSKSAISLSFKEVKKLRSQVEKLAPGIYKGLFRNRNCYLYAPKEEEHVACN